MAGQVKTYEVTVTREGRYWVAVVDGVRGGATETRSLPLLEGEVRDLIAGLRDVEEDAFELSWNFADALTPAAVAALGELDRWRAQMQEAELQYARAQSVAVERLASAGVSVRDAASLLGVSPAQVSQLTPARRRARAGVEQ